MKLSLLGGVKRISKSEIINTDSSEDDENEKHKEHKPQFLTSPSPKLEQMGDVDGKLPCHESENSSKNSESVLKGSTAAVSILNQDFSESDDVKMSKHSNTVSVSSSSSRRRSSLLGMGAPVRVLSPKSSNSTEMRESKIPAHFSDHFDAAKEHVDDESLNLNIENIKNSTSARSPITRSPSQVSLLAQNATSNKRESVNKISFGVLSGGARRESSNGSAISSSSLTDRDRRCSSNPSGEKSSEIETILSNVADKIDTNIINNEDKNDISCIKSNSCDDLKKRIDQDKIGKFNEQQCSTKKKSWHIQDFVLGKPLGRGKFGNVYLGRLKGSMNFRSEKSQVALKVLFKTPMIAASCVNNLRREVEIQSRLKHPNIVQLLGYFHDVKNVYLVLEYLTGGELYKHVQNQHGGTIPESLCKTYMKDIVAAVQHMHERHVYHRDIKPENILLCCDNLGAAGHGPPTISRLCVGDFGWAVHAPPGAGQTRYTLCGTPEYLSPEMVAGHASSSSSNKNSTKKIFKADECIEIDSLAITAGHNHKVDIWGLGILMYELLVGRTPFLERTRSKENVQDDQQDNIDREDDEREEQAQQQAQDRTFRRILKHKANSINIPSDSCNSGGDPLDISDEAQELINALLHPHSTQRPDAAAVYKFAWFHRY